jgi:hypothetical protein
VANFDKTIAKTCFYRCTGGQLVLIGGGAPAGYFCPTIVGSCAIEGETITKEPKPIPPGEARLSFVGSNSAAYEFDFDTDSLYFSEGQAEPGYMFLPKISLSELWKKFPMTAREIELIKHAKSISSFFVEIPAVAIAHETK